MEGEGLSRNMYKRHCTKPNRGRIKGGRWGWLVWGKNDIQIGYISIRLGYTGPEKLFIERERMDNKHFAT